VNTITTTTAASALHMSSREIAELVGSRHDDVKRSIERLAKKGIIALPPMAEAGNINNLGLPQKSSHYLFSGEQGKRDSIVVVARLSPEFTARLVDRWQELEARQQGAGFHIPQTMPEALRLAADLAEQNQRLAQENKAQEQQLLDAAPKARGFDLIAAGEKSITLREAAKLLGLKQNHLTEWLHQNGWVYRLNGRWVAYQHHIQGGRLIYKEARYTDEKTGHEAYAPYCHITPKGLAKLARAFGVVQEALAA